MSAIDRPGRCREAFRPASASRRGAEVWASPSPTWGRRGLPLTPPRPAQPPPRPAGSAWELRSESHRSRCRLHTKGGGGSTCPGTLLRHCFHPSGSAARVPDTCVGPGPATHQSRELFHPEGPRRIPGLSPPPTPTPPQALFRFLALWVSLAFWRISCKQSPRGRPLFVWGLLLSSDPPEISWSPVPASTPRCERTSARSSVLLLVDIWGVSSFLARTNKAAMNICQ